MKVKHLYVAGMLCSLCVVSAVAQNVNKGWVGDPADGGSGFWSDPSHWSPSGVPVLEPNAITVTIAPATPNTVRFDTHIPDTTAKDSLLSFGNCADTTIIVYNGTNYGFYDIEFRTTASPARPPRPPWTICSRVRKQTIRQSPSISSATTPRSGFAAPSLAGR